MSLSNTRSPTRRSLGLACALAFALPALPVRTATANRPKKPLPAAVNKGVFGYWKHVDEDTGRTTAVFRVWKHKDELVGRILKRFPKPGERLEKTCTECSGRRHNRPIDGMMFLWGFKPDEDEHHKWIDGQVLNPEDGKVYHAEVELSEDGKRLEVYGYIRVVFKIGGTSIWQRPTARELKAVL